MQLKSFIENQIEASTGIGKLLQIPMKIYQYYYYHLIPEKQFVQNQFKKHYGYPLDLENPKTFNEKLHWLKLYDRTTLHTQCADKFAVRSYVENKVGKDILIPLIFHTKNCKELTAKHLKTTPAIIKANHSTGTYIIIRKEQDAKWNDIQKQAQKWLKTNHYYRGKEWQYKNIPPCIIIEKLLTDDQGNIPEDYKLHCFNGQVRFIQTDRNRFGDKHFRTFYSPEWDFLNFTFSPIKSGHLKWPQGKPEPQPEQLKQMIEIAQKLSSPFSYVRVDLYLVNQHIYFGELTFHPGSGLAHFTPNSWDLKIGEWLSLPSNNKL